MVNLHKLLPAMLLSLGALATANGCTRPSPPSTRSDEAVVPASAALPAAAPPAATAARPGLLTLVCSPTCNDILVDGKSLGSSPLVGAPFPAGDHAVLLRMGTQEKALTIHVIAGQSISQRVDMNDVSPSGSAPADPNGLLAEARRRDELDAKLTTGTATLDDLRLLKAICGHLGDVPCRERAAAALGAKLGK